jgi:hypothetical protein
MNLSVSHELLKLASDLAAITDDANLTELLKLA